MVFCAVLGYLVALLFCYVRCVWCFAVSFGCLALFVGDLWYSGGFWWCLGCGVGGCVEMFGVLVFWFAGWVSFVWGWYNTGVCYGFKAAARIECLVIL